MDLEDLINDLNDSINYIESETPKLKKDLGEIAVNNIKKLTPRDTGKLQNSIRATQHGDTIIVDSDLDYADDVEFGHMQEARYVPELDRMLEPKFIKGNHMFENGMVRAEKELDDRVEDFLDNLPIFK